MKEHGTPELGYIEDSKGNVFKIKDLNKKQTAKLIGEYKKRGRISISKMRALYHQLYNIEARTMPKYAEMRRLEIMKKIAKELKLVVDENIKNHFKKLDDITEQYEKVTRHQLVINMAILQLENGAKKDVILQLLKQCLLDDWDITGDES